jgi:hypothetical protein
MELFSLRFIDIGNLAETVLVKWSEYLNILYRVDLTKGK